MSQRIAAHSNPEALHELLVTRMPLLTGDDLETKRQEILDYFHNTFTLYESLFDCLASEDAFYARANPLRHPLIFYYGHTAVFFINKLNVAKLIDQRVDARLESILAIGVDEMSWDDLDQSHYEWPTPTEVKAYREQTRWIVDRFLRETDFALPIDWDDPMWVILMGIEHERIHLETTAVLIRELPLEYVQPHPIWSQICRESGPAPENALLPVSGGRVRLGKERGDRLYGWDNEYGTREVDIEPFRASKYLVSNQEFLEFVQDRGYQTPGYWTDEGWEWVQFRQATHPVQWVVQGDSYRYRAMLEVIDMPWNWPVEINYLEAKAFCNWKSKRTGRSIRMPTEAEWYRLRERVATDQPDWDRAPGNINLEYEMSPCPVDRHEFQDGFFDLIGNVWQWTETPIDGYCGFQTHPVYDDFSTPTFDGKHNLFKGGCWISTGNYAIRDSRYAFRRHFFQYSGLRYVEAAPLPEPCVNVYETDSKIAQYIEFHYGETHFGVPNFPVTCARAALQALGPSPKERALDLGCAAGRAAFELARVFAHVDAVDFSARLIEAPVNLQQRGVQPYVIADEGELVLYKTVRLSDFPGYEEVKDRISFLQGDACNLAGKFDDYDLVLAGNLLDRLYDPGRFLDEIGDRIRSGGLLVLASPYWWCESFTPRDKWLGGFKSLTGETYRTLDGIAEHLSDNFQMLGAPRDVPFVLRETSRNFQYSVSELTIWKKR